MLEITPREAMIVSDLARGGTVRLARTDQGTLRVERSDGSGSWLVHGPTVHKAGTHFSPVPTGLMPRA